MIAERISIRLIEYCFPQSKQSDQKNLEVIGEIGEVGLETTPRGHTKQNLSPTEGTNIQPKNGID